MTTAKHTSRLPSVPNNPTKAFVEIRAMPWATGREQSSTEMLADKVVLLFKESFIVETNDSKLTKDDKWCWHLPKVKWYKWQVEKQTVSFISAIKWRLILLYSNTVIKVSNSIISNQYNSALIIYMLFRKYCRKYKTWQLAISTLKSLDGSQFQLKRSNFVSCDFYYITRSPRELHIFV